MHKRASIFRYPIVALILTLCLTSGCGIIRGIFNKGHRSGSGEKSVDKVVVNYDASVPEWQVELMEKDLEILSDVGFTDLSTDKDILNIASFSNEDLRSWMQARYHHVVGETFKENKTVERSNVPYTPSLSESIDPWGSTIIMRNVGAGSYTTGKDNKQLYSLQLSSEKLYIKSPRVGLFMIGKGLFTLDKTPGGSSKDDVSSYFRLGTLFHEARHCDGNGTHAAFLHKKCIDGNLKGEYACDDSLNGPYPVGRVILERLRAICTWCSSKETRALDLNIADLLTRTLPTAIMRDPRPEAIP